MKKIILLLILTITLHAEVLNLSISANPSRFNPIIATDTASSAINAWIFNGLLKYDKDAQIVPEIASSYRFITPTLLEFKLRDDVFWSDGVKFSPQDVVFTYETILSPTVHTPYSSDFTHVKSVKIVDENTIHVEYKYPYFKALQMWMMGLLPYHILKDEKDIMTSSFNQNPIGTGPYILDKYELSKNIELRANDNYFEGRPKLDKLIFHFLPDRSTEFLMLKSKKLDLSSITPLQFEKQLDDDFYTFYDIHDSVAYTYAYMGFNLKDPKFQNRKIREALALGLDIRQIVDIMLFGQGEVARGPFLPKTEAFNDSVLPTPYDPKRAKEILASLGFDEKNPFTFTITTSVGDRVNIAQIIQYQLAKIGVEVKIRVMEWQAFLNTVIAPRKFEAILLGWSLGLKSDAYSIWHSDSQKKGGFNFVGYKNKRVDELIIKAQSEVDEHKFGQIYQEIFKLIAEDYPYVFLFIPYSKNVVNKNIHPIEPSLIGITHNVTNWEKIDK